MHEKLTLPSTHLLSWEMRFKSKLLSFQTMSVWKRFQERYPNADLSRFTQTDWFGDSGDYVYFKSKDGTQMTQVFGKSMSNKYYFIKEIKKALGHPAELNVEPVPAIDLSNFP